MSQYIAPPAASIDKIYEYNVKGLTLSRHVPVSNSPTNGAAACNAMNTCEPKVKSASKRLKCKAS